MALDPQEAAEPSPSQPPERPQPPPPMRAASAPQPPPPRRAAPAVPRPAPQQAAAEELELELELADTAAQIEVLQRQQRHQQKIDRGNLKLKVLGSQTMTVERSLGVAGKSTEDVHRFQQDVFKTLEMNNAAARKNAETSLALSETAHQHAAANSKVAAHLADIGGSLRDLVGGRPAGKSGAEVFGEFGGELLRQLGSVAQSVLGGGGSPLAGLLDGKLGEVLAGLGGPGGAARQPDPGEGATASVPDRDQGSNSGDRGEGGGGAAPAAAQAPPRAGQSPRGAPAHPRSEAVDAVAVLIDRLPPEMQDKVARAMKDPEQAAHLAEMFLQAVNDGSR